MVVRFGMANSKLVNSLLVPHFKLSATMAPNSEDKVDYMAQASYASAVCSLMYAMVCTRPDIAQVMSKVSTYMVNSGK